MPTNSAVNAWTHLMPEYDATPSPTSLALWPSTPMMAAAPTIGTDHLRAEVTGDLRPGELAGDGEPDRDGRVDVVATDVPEGVDGGDHDRAEGQRDHAEIGHRERCIAVDDQGGGHGPDTDEHQERGPDGLCGELLCCGGLVEHLLSFRARVSNVIRYSRTLRGRYYHDSLMHKTLRHTLSADVNSREARAVIQSVDRAIRVLTALQGARRMSLSELSTRLDLAPSTTHGIVRTLVEHGMVVQERGSSRYQLGPGRAPARQRLPRHPRAAVQGGAVGRGPRPAYRHGRAHRRPAHRRRRDHPPRASPRREPADARGRDRDPGPRQRPRQGDARVRTRRRRPDAGGR